MRGSANPILTGSILLLAAILISTFFISIRKVEKPAHLDETSIDGCLANGVSN